jgi:hypothetical protein
MENKTMSKRIALLSATALMLAVGALPVLAQPGPGDRGPAHGGRGFAMGEAFARADANNDGQVSRDEGWTWLQARFQEVDADRDRGVTIEEMRTYAQARMGNRGPQQRAERHGQGMFRALDANADGKVSLEEIRPFAEAMFRARDANADNALTREEIRPARGMRGGHHQHGDRRGPPPAPQSN